MAGVSRLQYTSEARLVRVMCAGRVDLAFVLRAFVNGMDGVFIGGCRLGECNYMTHGNYQALNMVLLCRKIMAHIGLDPRRLYIEFMSSGEGLRFVEVMNAFGRQVTALGPLGSGEEADAAALKQRLEQVQRLVPYIKMAKREKLETRLADEAAYDDFFDMQEVERLFSDAPAFYIDPAECRACMICRRRCPVDAIDGAKNRIHVIDQNRCIKCGTCLDVCPPRFNAVRRIKNAPVPPPPAEKERTIRRKPDEKKQ